MRMRTRSRRPVESSELTASRSSSVATMTCINFDVGRTPAAPSPFTPKPDVGVMCAPTLRGADRHGGVQTPTWREQAAHTLGSGPGPPAARWGRYRGLLALA